LCILVGSQAWPCGVEALEGGLRQRQDGASGMHKGMTHMDIAEIEML